MITQANALNGPVHTATHRCSSNTAEAGANKVVNTSDSSTSLATLSPGVEEIHQLHGEVWYFRRMSLDKGIRVGEILIKLKDECGRGKWLPFVEEHLPFCERTAQVYMELYRGRDLMESAEPADLPMCWAVRLMPKARSKRTEPSSTPSRVPVTILKAKPPEWEHGTLGDLQPAEAATSVTEPNGPKPDAQIPPGAITEKDAPSIGVPATATAKVARHIAEQFLFTFVEGPGFGADGWCDGVIDQQQVHEELESLAENPQGESLQEVAETQRLIVRLAGCVNSVVPATATAATLSNLRHASDWLTRTITILLQKKLSV